MFMMKRAFFILPMWMLITLARLLMIIAQDCCCPSPNYCNSSHYDHITPVLRNLHWLPIKLRIQYKILLITFKALHNLAPIYIQELISIKQSTNYSLRSNQSLFLAVPVSRSYKTLGDRAFSYFSPYLWNLYRSESIIR